MFLGAVCACVCMPGCGRVEMDFCENVGGRVRPCESMGGHARICDAM